MTEDERIARLEHDVAACREQVNDIHDALHGDRDDAEFAPIDIELTVHQLLNLGEHQRDLAGSFVSGKVYGVDDEGPLGDVLT